MNPEKSDFKTVTEGPRSLEHFTGRQELIQRFSQYVNEDPPQATVLFFYGVGGIGKSLLLRFFRKHCCRYLSGLYGSEDATYAYLRQPYDTTLTSLPTAALDFGMQPYGDKDPKDPWHGLLMLRCALGGGQLHFPLFDFACIWYLHRTKQLSRDRLASLFPSDEVTMLGAIVDTVSKHSFGAIATGVINVFGKHFKDRALLHWKMRNLETVDIKRIQDFDTDSDLIAELPACFAADLNSSMAIPAAPKRIVLFFDTYEAFWGHERNLGHVHLHRRDQWFRSLISSVQPERGIVFVVAGQEVPRWSKTAKYPVSESRVEYHRLGNLSELEAQKYLKGAEIEDAAMRSAVSGFSQVEPDQIHPLLLGLSVDVILEARTNGIALRPEEFAKSSKAADIGLDLIEHLIQYADQGSADAVHAISACRAFDQDLYFKLAGELRFDGTYSAFRKLISFSFVSPAEGRAEGSFKVHELLRRLIHESNNDLERRANKVLEGYYRTLTGHAARAEAVYHATRIDCERGVREWVEVFDLAFWSSDLSLCRALLGLRGVLGVKDHFLSGMLARCEADFLRIEAQSTDSDREYKRALWHFERARQESDHLELMKHSALLLIHHGTLQSELSQFSEATNSFRNALSVCDQALRTAVDDLEIFILQAAAYLGLGDVNIWAVRSKPAVANYSEGVALCDRALRKLRSYSPAMPMCLSLGGTLGRSPNEVMVCVLNDKAYGVGGIGDVEASLFRHTEALSKYREALSCYDQALGIEVDPIVQNDRAFTLVSLAEVEIERLQFDEALGMCQQAVSVFDELVKRAPQDIIYKVNGSRALRVAGSSLARLSREDEAQQLFDRALRKCAEVLNTVPNDTWALCNEGLTLLCIGEKHLENNDDVGALKTFADGRAAFERLLTLTPSDDEALAGLGALYFYEGEAIRKTDRTQAITKYRQSSEAFDEALANGSEDAETEADKARTLQRLGEIYLETDRRKDALRSLNDALKAYDHSLKIAPRHLRAREARRRLKALLAGLRTSSPRNQGG